MVFFLILGALLGAISVVFVLQNITPITVTFFTWHIDGSLSIVLFLALLSGMLVTILLLVPGFIRDEWRFGSLKKQNKDLEAQLAQAKQDLAELALRTASAPSSSVLHETTVS
jgi:uncharacterized integral membrane protein